MKLLANLSGRRCDKCNAQGQLKFLAPRTKACSSQGPVEFAGRGRSALIQQQQPRFPHLPFHESWHSLRAGKMAFCSSDSCLWCEKCSFGTSLLPVCALGCKCRKLFEGAGHRDNSSHLNQYSDSLKFEPVLRRCLDVPLLCILLFIRGWCDVEVWCGQELER